MAHNFTLAQEAKIVGVMAPAADAAGRTGRWVSTKNAHKMYLIAYINQGNAATVALTINQATSASGTSSKAITGNARIWTNLDLATNDTITRQADAVSYTTDAGVKEKEVIIEIDPATLDVANGFSYVTIITGASNAANITSAIAVATPVRYPGDGQPSITT